MLHSAFRVVLLNEVNTIMTTAIEQNEDRSARVKEIVAEIASNLD
jgi:hypothetical protein